VATRPHRSSGRNADGKPHASLKSSQSLTSWKRCIGTPDTDSSKPTWHECETPPNISDFIFPGTASARLLARDGTFEISYGSLGTERFGRVRMSNRRVSTKDRFLYHKTTNRRAYDQELAAAREAKCDDVLFFNERGELTEGTIHNVFVVKNGAWRTPAVACGLLPGTCRARILHRRSNAREAILTRDDLTQADNVYPCNSVRGIFLVNLVLDNRTPQ
jgi:branched-subunit amino acid aminotransferase/4-amino-4-deoxychorismate lyase